jgi:hypothetical protein
MKILALTDPVPSGNTFREVLVEQLLNSAVVAGVAAIATWTGTAPDVPILMKAFTLTFLIELRKYRAIIPVRAPAATVLELVPA